MAWSPAQIEALYSNVYAFRDVCPACGGKLAVTRTNEPGTFAIVHCPGCDEQHVLGERDDPLRGAFRAYTEAERKAIFVADRMRQTPVCPVDGSPMMVHAQRSFGLTSNVVVRCRRCDQSVSFTRLYG